MDMRPDAIAFFRKRTDSPRTMRNGGEDRRVLNGIVEWCEDAIIGHDLDGAIVIWNRSAESLLGYSAAEIIGQAADVLLPDEKRAETQDVLDRLQRGDRITPYHTIRKRMDGTLVNVLLTASPVRNDEGTLVGASYIVRDATDLELSRSQLTLLISEMRHRVRNLAAVIEALGRSAIPRHETSIAGFFDNFMGRVRAVLAAGEIVLSSSAREADLEEVAKAALLPFANGDKTRIRLNGPSLALTERCAGGLVLAFHELATNALKYGALKDAGGTINIDWSARQDDVTIVWKEHVSHAVAVPANRGFGSKLIKAAISGEQNSETKVTFEPDGLKCVFKFALSR